MKGPITIALDAMGGDHGPRVTVPAALAALRKHARLQLVLVGNSEILRELLNAQGITENNRLSIRHASQEVLMAELPSYALRNKKDSSMRVAINLVQEGVAQACVSAGNTGALMALARFVLKTLPGVDRPAIMASFPTEDPHKETRVLDLGANVDSCADHLYQFAVMGSVVAMAVAGIPNPKVGLLNIGQEEIKGNDQVKQTAQLLSENSHINYIGYVEGDDIFKGVVDVVVCDGFVGNIALKTGEGLARLINGYIKKTFTSHWWGRIAALFVIPYLKSIKEQLDPARRNGASFLGLQGIVVKSHGSASVEAYTNAIDKALAEVANDVPRRIRDEVGAMLEAVGR